MTKEIWQLLKERNTAFRSGEEALYSVARSKLERGIRKAKLDYRRRIEFHRDSNDSRQVWQGIQHITNYKTSAGAAKVDFSLAEGLNHFFAHFEVKPPEEATSHLAVNNDIVLTVGEHEVGLMLQAVNPWKAAGLDGTS